MPQQDIALGSPGVAGDLNSAAWGKTQANFDQLFADKLEKVEDLAGLVASTAGVVQQSDGSGFILSADQVAAADNVLRIERSNGSIVERIWDQVNFFVDWVPLNLPVGTWGTPLTNGDRISAGVTVMPSGATMHLSRSTTYLMSMPAEIGSITINGNGATIKREDQRSSLLTANASAGASSVTVADASVFRVGQRCFVVKTSGVLGGHAMVDGSSALYGSAGFVITDISGNVVTFNGTLQQAVVIGNKLVALDNIFLQSGSDRATFHNCTFDGNKASHADVLDWAAGWSISAHKLTVSGCRFINAPNENITAGSGLVIDCDFEDCDGSIVHVSNTAISEASGLLLQNLRATNICTKYNGHDEGVITFSATSQNVRIRDCLFDNSAGTRGQGVFGLLDAAYDTDYDGNIYAENVVAKNYASIATISVQLAERNFDRLHLVNCDITDCRAFVSGAGGDITNGPYIKEAVISGCNFVNCWFTFGSVRNVKWRDNTVAWDIGGGGVYVGVSPSSTFATLPTTRLGGSALVAGDFAGMIAADGAYAAGVYVWSGSAWVFDAVETAKLPPAGTLAAVALQDCGSVDMSGGYIVAPPFPGIDGQMTNGVWLYCTAAAKTEAGTSTFAYMQAKVSNIDIAGFVGSLTFNNSSWWATVPAFDVLGWTFDNVKVWPIRSNVWTNVVGIEVPAGAVATGCHVYIPDTADQGATCGIVLKGPIDPTKTVGGVARNCYVPFAPAIAGTIYCEALRIGTTSGTLANVHKNCVAINNILAKAPAQAAAGDKIESGNTIINASSIAGLTAPAAFPFRPVGRNENLY